jgi:hypothetical protein
LNRPDKIWKFDAADIAERALWDRYHVDYQRVIGATAAELLVAGLLSDALRALKPQFPKPEAAPEQAADAAAASSRWSVRTKRPTTSSTPPAAVSPHRPANGGDRGHHHAPDNILNRQAQIPIFEYGVIGQVTGGVGDETESGIILNPAVG